MIGRGALRKSIDIYTPQVSLVSLVSSVLKHTGRWLENRHVTNSYTIYFYDPELPGGRFFLKSFETFDRRIHPESPGTSWAANEAGLVLKLFIWGKNHRVRYGENIKCC